MSKQETQRYTLDARLLDTETPVWRRFEVDSSTTLPTMHAILQTLFDWGDYHLHEFVAGGVEYAPKEFEIEDTLEDARVPISDLLKVPGDVLVYQYDFGDDWEVSVTLQSVGPAGRKSPPVCIAGQNAGPLEDMGGRHHYDVIYRYFDGGKDRKKFKEYAELIDWLRPGWDPRVFEAADVNADLATIKNTKRRYRTES